MALGLGRHLLLHGLGIGGWIAIVALSVPASAQASFSGQNGKIFFQGPQSGTSGPADVFSINPDGTGELDLTFENGYSDERPSASADGQHVVFQSFRDEGWNIFSMNADGSNQVDLTNTKFEPNHIVNFEPAWSPDGSKVAFMRQAAGRQDIWVVNANGTGQMDLTESLALYATAPEFSPDGSKILFIGAGPTPCCTTAYNNDIWVMNANGSNAKQLTTTNAPTQNTGPTWSPDGLRIAYSTSESPGAIDNGLHVMNADGTEQHRVLREGAPIPTGNLSWSPDGTKIAYEGAGGGSISTMSSDGTEPSPLIANSGASYPSWVPAQASTPGGGTIPPPATGGGSTPLPAPLPGLSPAPGVSPPAPCKKGFKKKVVKGKVKCVKRHKKHRKHKRKP
jgi:Tol biopolymer transport system component